MLRSFAIAFAALAVGAAAEPVNDDALRFSVVFPCPSATSSQLASTPAGSVAMTMYVCQSANGAYYVAISETPKDAVTEKNRDSVLSASIAGIAANLRGALHSAEPLATKDGIGRDVLIDIPEQKAVVHGRIYWTKDRLYQAMTFGPAGSEVGPEALAFLDSFKIK